jgi:hypothetical protein
MRAFLFVLPWTEGVSGGRAEGAEGVAVVGGGRVARGCRARGGQEVSRGVSMVGADAALTAAGGGFAGFVAALVTFRTQLAMMGRDNSDLRDEQKRQRRLSLAILQCVSDMASKLGVDNRSVSDMLIRAMQEDNDNGG